MMNLRWTLPSLVALLSISPLIGMSAAGSAHVHIQGFAFSPSGIIVVAGDTVEWDNHDAAPHTVTDVRCPRAGGAGPCEFDSNPDEGGMARGEFFAHTFDATATFEYMCTIHIFFGTLTVVAPGGPDLTVDSLVVGAGSSDDERAITATVRNQGDAIAAESDVALSYVYKNAPRTIASIGVGPLAPGETRTVTATWDASLKVGDFTIRALADAGASVAEPSEDNNARFASTSILVAGVAGRDVLDP